MLGSQLNIAIWESSVLHVRSVCVDRHGHKPVGHWAIQQAKGDMMKNFLPYIMIVVISATAFLAGAATAQPEFPEGVEVFHVEDRTILRDTELEIILEWCTDSCTECEEQVATSTPRPTDPPYSDPTPTEQRPTDVPPTNIPPTEKPKCNRGLGNGPEFCDPGNSGGNPGSAGEDNE